MPTRKRLAAYDVMRIVAILLVLYNHLPGYHLYYQGTGTMLCVGLLLSVLARIGVPLFAMVSGALLLGRNESYADLWRKRLSRMLGVVVVFEALLYVEFHFTRNYPLSLPDFLRGMLAGTLKDMVSYWFLYAYLGFLLMLPFLRRVAQAMTRADFLWLLAIHVLLTTGPTLATFVCKCCGWPALTISKSLAVSLSSVTLYFYPLIGYWIDRHVDVHHISRRWWAALTATTLAGMLLSAWMTWRYDTLFATHVQDYLGLTVYVTACAVFLWAKRTFDAGFAQRRPHANAALCFAGPLVFGVYLMDQDLKLLIYEPLKTMLFSPLGALGFSLVWCVVSLVMCGAATWVLKGLPLFRKLL